MRVLLRMLELGAWKPHPDDRPLLWRGRFRRWQAQIPENRKTLQEFRRMPERGTVLAALGDVIESRRGGSVEKSYTSRLLAGGPEAVGRKVTEEAGELVAAATGETDERVVAETADLLYHTLVLLASRGLTLSEVEGELARRFGVSGIEEKASRGATTNGGTS